jgi:hypothetical protein
MMKYKLINKFSNVNYFYPAIGSKCITANFDTNIYLNGNQIDAGRVILSNSQVENWNLDFSKN